MEFRNLKGLRNLVFIASAGFGLLGGCSTTGNKDFSSMSVSNINQYSNVQNLEQRTEGQVYQSATKFLTYDASKFKKLKALNWTCYLGDGIAAPGQEILSQIFDFGHFKGTGEFVDISDDGSANIGYQSGKFPIFGGYRITFNSENNNLNIINESSVISYAKEGESWIRSVYNIERIKFLESVKGKKNLIKTDRESLKKYIQEGKIEGVRLVSERKISESEVKKYLDLLGKIKEKYPAEPRSEKKFQKPNIPDDFLEELRKNPPEK